VNAPEEPSGESSKMEESEEESEEDSMEAFAVSAIEARSLASMLIGANWEGPQVVVLVAGGAALEWAVSALEATMSTMEARSLASISTGVSLEEPWIMPDVGRLAEVEPDVLTEACAVAREPSLAAV